MAIRTDCRFFRGDLPCRPHKQEDVHCEDCSYYEPTRERILIIKLGAIGDVIRTTPLLRRLKQAYPDAEITWLTHFPEVIPTCVDHVLTLEMKDILGLLATHFDIVYSLDKDKEACALAEMIDADVKKGFTLEGGRCAPIDKDAEHKWLTGLFDDVNRANTKSYPQEIFEICGFQFRGEEYILDSPRGKIAWHIPELRPLIGLNTGCGERWATRLWPEQNWVQLSKRLKQEGYGVLLLGGRQEHEKNTRIAEETGATYLGHFPLNEFIALVDQCTLIVTAVTMALHIAIGLGKRIVLFNNVFNRDEFELYGLGEIVEPEVSCKGCYRECCDTDCMSLIEVDDVLSVCKNLLEVHPQKRSKQIG